MKNNYLLEGSDYVSLKQKIDSIIEKNDFKDAMVSIYDLDEVILDNALEDLDTYGFLSSKKVIIIKTSKSSNSSRFIGKSFIKNLNTLYKEIC